MRKMFSQSSTCLKSIINRGKTYMTTLREQLEEFFASDYKLPPQQTQLSALVDRSKYVVAHLPKYDDTYQYFLASKEKPFSLTPTEIVCAKDSYFFRVKTSTGKNCGYSLFTLVKKVPPHLDVEIQRGCGNMIYWGSIKMKDLGFYSNPDYKVYDLNWFNGIPKSSLRLPQFLSRDSIVVLTQKKTAWYNYSVTYDPKTLKPVDFDEFATDRVGISVCDSAITYFTKSTNFLTSELAELINFIDIREAKPYLFKDPDLTPKIFDVDGYTVFGDYPLFQTLSILFQKDPNHPKLKELFPNLNLDGEELISFEYEDEDDYYSDDGEPGDSESGDLFNPFLDIENYLKSML